MSKPILIVGLLAAALIRPDFAPAESSVTTGVLTSFDGTKIVYDLSVPSGCTAATPCPAVIGTHGWGGDRKADRNNVRARALARGFVTLSWDSRGFGQSGDVTHVNSPEYEVRDALALIDMLATRSEVAKDAPGDPRFGMVGGSYGGIIQMNVAGVDSRVDVIVPEIAPHELGYALEPNRVPKIGWDALLLAAGTGTGTEHLDPTGATGTSLLPRYDQRILGGFQETVRDNKASESTLRWYKDRSPARFTGGIHVPALFLQSFADNLFPMNEAVANMSDVTGAPTKFVVYCASGHLICPFTSAGQATNARWADIVDRWLDRWLRDSSIDTGPAVEYVTQDGVWHSAPSWPPATNSATASGSGTIVNLGPAGARSGALMHGTRSVDPITSLTVPIMTATAPRTLIGIPSITVTANVSGAGETFLFFQLTESGAGAFPISSQVTPLRVEPGLNTYTLDLNGISHALEAGKELLLQVMTDAGALYATARGVSTVDVDVTVNVPVRA